MKIANKIMPAFNEVMQKVKKGTSKLITSETAKSGKIPNYVAIKMNGIIAYVPAEKVPKGAEILTQSLTSSAELLAEMNKGLVNKIYNQ